MDRDILGAMEVFVSVVDSGSFSESARRLGISQPSVSRQVSALESRLGVRLLQRSTRRLSLTEAGQVFYEKAHQIQLDVIEAQQAISGFRETPSGVLRMSTPYVWVEAKITPWLGEFLRKYPQIKLDIECNDQFQDMIEDQLDLVIRIGELTNSSFVAVPLGRIRLVLCATPEYLRAHGTPESIADLNNHSFIVYRGFNRLLVSPRNAVPQHLSVTGPVSSNTVSVMLAAIQQHLGLSVIPDLLISRELSSGKLVNVMPQAEFEIQNLPISQIYALYSNRRHLPAKVRAFIDFFKPRFSSSPLDDVPG